jgi:hypothetical protein
MKNKLLLNNKARNHIKVFPVDKTIVIPEGEAEKIKWAESVYKRLELESVNLVTYKNKSRGYMISVWQMDDKYYIIESIRNEFKTFNNTIYINDNKNDSLAIAKFLKDNIITIMSDYKQQLLDAKDSIKYEGTQHTKLN